jgi:predicted thioesterase
LFFGVEEDSFFAGVLAAGGAGLEVFAAGFVVGFVVGLATALVEEGLDFGESFLAGMFYLCSLYFA